VGKKGPRGDRGLVYKLGAAVGAEAAEAPEVSVVRVVWCGTSCEVCVCVCVCVARRGGGTFAARAN